MKLKYLFALLMFLAPVSAQATLNFSEDWTGSCPFPSYWSFSYGTNNCPNLAPTANLTAGGGQALNASMGAGVYTSSNGGGIHTYAPLATSNQQDLYFSHDIQWSNPFDWNPIGTKFDYVQTAFASIGGNEGSSNDNFLLMIQGGAAGNVLTFTQQLMHCIRVNNRVVQGGNTCTQNRGTNAGAFSAIIKAPRTYRVTVHARMNTWSCSTITTYTCANTDGWIRVWWDGVLVMDHRDVVHSIRPGNYFLGFQHAFIWGGGGGTVNQAQYVRYDRLRIGTTLADVDVSAGGGGGDTTAPTTPTITGITKTSTTAAVAFTGSTDFGGMRLYRALRCTNSACTTHTQVGSVNHTSGTSAGSYTFNDTGLTPSTTYSWRMIAEDTSFNPSPASTAMEATTDAASALPTITAFATSGTGANVAWSSSPATANVKFRYGGTLTNGQPWNAEITRSIAQLPGGVLSFPWPQNTQWGCAEAGNAVPTYNTTPSAYFCAGITPQPAAAAGILRALPSNPIWLTLDGTTAIYRVGISGGTNCNASFCGLQDIFRSSFSNLIPSTTITHTFDGTTTDLGTFWTAGYGSYARLDINSGVVRPSSVGDDNAETYAVFIHGDQSAEIDVGTFNDVGFGKIALKVNYAAPGTDSGYQCRLFRNGPGGITSRITKVTAGVGVALATESATTWATGNKERCRRIGDTLYLDRSTNGGVSWTNLLSAVDATYRDGRVGLALLATTAVTNVTADNFKAGPIVADYATMLNQVVSEGGNWIRMWLLEQSVWCSDAVCASGNNLHIPLNQFPYNQVSTRVDTSTGTSITVGVYDLNEMYQPFFDRIQARVDAALALGITPIITMFSGGHLNYGLPPTWNAGFSHPFYSGNNVNGVSCDTITVNEACEEAHSLSIAGITAAQQLYVDRLIQTLGNRPVILEVSNEDQSDTTLWQNMIMEWVRTAETTYGTSAHVIFQSGFNFGSLANSDHLFDNARNDAVSPLCTSDGTDWDLNPPANDGTKLIFYDSDHTGYNDSCGTWTAIVPWKLFTRGIYPIFLSERESAPVQTAVKAAMAQAKFYGAKINLATAYPETGTGIYSTGYGLTTFPTVAGCSEFLMLMPADGSSTINLTSCPGGTTFDVETLNLTSGVIASAGTTTGGAVRSFNPAGSDPMVIYLKSTGTAADTTAPILSAGFPSGVLVAGTTETPMRVTSDETSECKYDTTAGVAHASKATAFSTTDVLNHETTVDSLTDDTSYLRYVTCRDPSGNVSAEMTIAFRVAADVDDTLPTDASAVTGSSTDNDTAILWQWVAGADDNLTHHIIEIYLVNIATGELTTLAETANITSGTVYLQRGLVAGNAYRAQVKAADALNVSLNWATSPIVLVDLPETMTGLTVLASQTFTNSAIMTVNEAAQGGVQGSYELCTGALCTSGWAPAGVPAGLSVTFSSLTPGTIYGARGKWVNLGLGGVSANWSATKYFTTATTGQANTRLTESAVNPRSTATKSSSSSKLTR